MKEKLARMKELVPYLSLCAYAYEQEDREIISNYEYDKLYDELKRLEEETGIVLAGSVTQNVGFEVSSKLQKVEHASKMLSLDKTKEVDKLVSFVGNQTSLISWKLDGLTVVATYEDGELVSAVTRGNGTVGEDVTNNYKQFENVPLRISYKERLVVRGEAIITYSKFESINERLPEDEKYKNPRNLCSGSVRQLDSRVTASRGVQYKAFGVVEGLEDIDSKSDRFKVLNELGFDTVEYIKVDSSLVTKAVEYFKNNVKKSDFPSDGLVVTYDSESYSKKLGATAKFPRHSIAFKWADEVAETTLIDIEWSTSRTGAINPIAIFEPVELEGTTVERASVHNLSILEELELGYGDTISIYKANMIIPQISENFTRSGDMDIPTHCPVCGYPTSIAETFSKKDGLSRVTKVLMCNNLMCKAQLVRLLSHFVSREAMNIEGLSEATIEKFVTMGFIENLSDVYHLEDFEDDIINMEGFGWKSYENLVNAIDKSRTVGKENFIYALGIPNIGLNTAKLILNYFDNDFVKACSASYSTLMNIQGLGDVKASDFSNYFRNPDNLKVVNELLSQLEFKADKVVNTDSPIAGKNFVVTGNVYHYKNRKELQAHIESLGGKIVGSVSGNTDYLINNDIHSTSSKNKKAKELGVPIISEEDFLLMVNE